MLLAAAASPVPPPIDDLLPDPLLRDEVPEDVPWLLRLLPRADVYLQDEVEIALHPRKIAFSYWANTAASQLRGQPALELRPSLQSHV